MDALPATSQVNRCYLRTAIGGEAAWRDLTARCVGSVTHQLAEVRSEFTLFTSEPISVPIV